MDEIKRFAFGQKVRCVEPLAKFNQKEGDEAVAGLWYARLPGWQIIDGRFCRVARFEAIS